MSPLNRMAHRLLIGVFSFISVIVITLNGYGQQTILQEDFTKFYRRALAGGKDVYLLEPGPINRVDDHLPISLYVDPHDLLLADLYAGNLCDSTKTDHGFYTDLPVYQKGYDADNEVIVFRLDTVLPNGAVGNLSMDVVFHKFAKYRVDSIQALLLGSDKDIYNYLHGGPFAGQYVLFSLGDVDNVSWKTRTASFAAEHDYRYVLIGNLKIYGSYKIRKVNNCKCGPPPKYTFWDYSSILLDNILLTANN